MTNFLISVTKVSCQICSSDIIPGWDFQEGGIIILPIKNQWDNFPPRTKLILIKASNGEIRKKIPGPSPGTNITPHLLGFWWGEGGEGSRPI
jgi:hypothetical protein